MNLQRICKSQKRRNESAEDLHVLEKKNNESTEDLHESEKEHRLQNPRLETFVSELRFHSSVTLSMFQYSPFRLSPVSLKGQCMNSMNLKCQMSIKSLLLNFPKSESISLLKISIFSKALDSRYLNLIISLPSTFYHQVAG